MIARLQTLSRAWLLSAVAIVFRRVDFLQARVEVEAAAIELQNAKNRSTAVSRKMAAIVGVPDLDASRLQGNLDEQLKALTGDATLARLLSESPELAQAQAGVERARWMLQREWAGRVPTSIRWLVFSMTIRRGAPLEACPSACRCPYSIAIRETSATYGATHPFPRQSEVSRKHAGPAGQHGRDRRSDAQRRTRPRGWIRTGTRRGIRRLRRGRWSTARDQRVRR